MEIVKKLLEKLEALFAAAAFAEEGEVEAARQIVAQAERAEPPLAAARGAKRAPVRPRRRIASGKVARSS